MGIALAPDFETSGWIYLAYSALPLESLTQRVSRFQLDDNGDLDMDSELPVFEWTHLRETCCHSAGAPEFDPDGNLLISTGDNTNPFESQGYAPIDERAGRQSYDSQRTAANTNDQTASCSGSPPRRRFCPAPIPESVTPTRFPRGTCSRPAPRTLCRRSTRGLPEPVPVQGRRGDRLVAACRRRPRCRRGDPRPRPTGHVEYNVITEPGNFGWPYCVHRTPRTSTGRSRAARPATRSIARTRSTNRPTTPG